MVNNFEWTKLKLPDCGKEIKIKSWNYYEDVELHKKITNTNDKTKEIYVILDFLKDHVEDKELFDTLSEVDVYKILFTLRNNSKGNEISYSWKCHHLENENTKCKVYGQVQTSSLDVIDNVQYKLSKINDFKLDNEYTVYFKKISFINKLSLIKEVDSLSELKYKLVLGHIDSIIKNGDVLTFNTIKDVDNFLKEIEPKYVYKIISLYNDFTSSINITKDNICSVCKNKQELTVGSFDFFL
jgi:hypothetical protein